METLKYVKIESLIFRQTKLLLKCIVQQIQLPNFNQLGSNIFDGLLTPEYFHTYPISVGYFFSG